MSTLPRTTYAANLSPWGRESLSVPLADGGRLTVALEIDEHSDLDCFGRLEWTRDDQRPKGFDGGAVKLRARSGAVWFQPSPDYTPEGREATIERVRDYFMEGWSFVGVVVTRYSAPTPGPFGNDVTDSVSESLWGIESDAGDYFAEVAGDLAEMLGCEAA